MSTNELRDHVAVSRELNKYAREVTLSEIAVDVIIDPLSVDEGGDVAFLIKVVIPGNDEFPSRTKSTTVTNLDEAKAFVARHVSDKEIDYPPLRLVK